MIMYSIVACIRIFVLSRYHLELHRSSWRVGAEVWSEREFALRRPDGRAEPGLPEINVASAPFFGLFGVNK